MPPVSDLIVQVGPVERRPERVTVCNVEYFLDVLEDSECRCGSQPQDGNPGKLSFHDPKELVVYTNKNIKFFKTMKLITSK